MVLPAGTKDAARDNRNTLFFQQPFGKFIKLAFSM